VRPVSTLRGGWAETCISDDVTRRPSTLCQRPGERQRARDHHPETDGTRLAGHHPDLRLRQRSPGAGAFLRRQPQVGGVAVNYPAASGGALAAAAQGTPSE
jgi:hypothetical protein